MHDKQTMKGRGFGFVTFQSKEAINNALGKSFHTLKGKLVEVKMAKPKEMNVQNNNNDGIFFPNLAFTVINSTYFPPNNNYGVSFVDLAFGNHTFYYPPQAHAQAQCYNDPILNGPLTNNFYLPNLVPHDPIYTVCSTYNGSYVYNGLFYYYPPYSHDQIYGENFSNWDYYSYM
ncbi:Splicing factor-like protein [Trema orientale]|uniref:Splicing factor-like protein n=1 Tax=Trema orientale TaxID=63057 RepID=A0A2P5EZE7_TREOI|nr:Splicing factor-like protein [Trema orientale]